LRDALQRLETARDRVEAFQQASPGALLPDSSFTLQNAIREEASALAEYCRVLNIFTSLILERKIPDEESS
jgi:hypothetical protein